MTGNSVAKTSRRFDGTPLEGDRHTSRPPWARDTACFPRSLLDSAIRFDPITGRTIGADHEADSTQRHGTFSSRPSGCWIIRPHDRLAGVGRILRPECAGTSSAYLSPGTRTAPPMPVRVAVEVSTPPGASKLRLPRDARRPEPVRASPGCSGPRCSTGKPTWFAIPRPDPTRRWPPPDVVPSASPTQ